MKEVEAQKDRLERFIAHEGLASRREAKARILSGTVLVNGKVIREPGFGILPGKDTITIQNPHGVEQKEYVLLYKPRGIETSATSERSRDIRSVFPKFAHLSPVGRLDKESEGLIILTNDGTLTRALTKEDSSIGKTYIVTVRENVPDSALIRMRNGIKLDRVLTKPATAIRLARSKFSITLFEGRKHQIRRMCDACHLTIESLVRIAIGPVTIGGMKSGSMRKLSPEEIKN